MRIIAVIANFILLGFLIYQIFFVIHDVFFFIILIILVPLLTNIALFIKKDKLKIIIRFIGFIANVILLIVLISALWKNYFSAPPPPYPRLKGLLILGIFLIVTLFNIIVLWLDIEKKHKALSS